MWRLNCTQDQYSDRQMGSCMPLLRRSVSAFALRLAVLLGVSATVQAQGFIDPLDNPAQLYPQPLEALPIQALTQPDDKRLVAVGMRGVILVSDDQGEDWQQAAVPVSSDLLDVHFADARHGWAVGQDGVILASEDAGASWSTQLDGRAALTSLTRYYREQRNMSAQEREQHIQALDMNLGGGPVLPFLSVHFVDTLKGYASGSFGMLVRTEDGGRHWSPALEYIDNEDQLHLNAIAQVGQRLFIASEQGRIFVTDAHGGYFRQIETDHVGSFFSIAGQGRVILAGGLAGVIYASRDAGETWKPLKTPLTQLVTRIRFEHDNQRFVVATAGGEVLVLDADLGSPRLLELQKTMLLTDLISMPERTIYAGIQGLNTEQVTSRSVQRGKQ